MTGRPEEESMIAASVSVCFPAYNEELTIADVLREAHELLSASGIDYEIIVCDDGSKDGTGAIIDRVASELGRMRVLHHARNLGIRETFEHLYRVASKDYVFLNSTDRQWQTSILFDMLPLAKDWDIVIAARKKKHYGLAREIVSRGFNLIPVALFGVRTYDAGAVKLVKREIIERFELVSRSPFTEAERLIKAARAGYRITEYPVEVSARRTGKAQGVKGNVLKEALFDVARVWWSLRGKGGKVKPSRNASPMF
jgi:glycosyltransferase involved in cell wall biosynthesis